MKMKIFQIIFISSANVYLKIKKTKKVEMWKMKKPMNIK